MPCPNLMRHIETCTAHDPSRFLPFKIEGRVLGALAREHAALVCETGLFLQTDSEATFAPSYADSFEARTEALALAAQKLAAHYGRPLTKEIYPVIEHWGEKALALIDRAAIPWFGFCGFGVHVCGYVRKADGLYIWVATRSLDRRIDPGKRDTLVGGGMPLGYGIRENLAKEAWEEAGLRGELLTPALAQGCLRYRRDMMNGLRHDGLFQFDLELPESVQPRNTDGEVERFDLLPASEVLAILTDTDSFKFNCTLVMIDFLLRHRVIPETHPERAALLAAFARLKSPFGA